MPLQRCSVQGKAGWRWGQQGKCYPGPQGRAKALQQAKAIQARQHAANALGPLRAILAAPGRQTAPQGLQGAYRGLVGNRTAARARSPLKADPTRTRTLRRQFETQLGKLFDRLKGRILRLLVDEDALGLMQRSNNPFLGNTLLSINTRWKFMTSDAKVQAFEGWLGSQIKSVGAQSDVWEAYIKQGYQKGAGRAFDDTRKPATKSNLDFFTGGKTQFLRQSFAKPETASKLKLLTGRTLTDLKGVTDVMATRMTRDLADGLVQGKNPRAIARDINKSVDVGKASSQRIARTEIVRAHAEGQLDALEELGVDEIGVAIEWDTAGDGRVCKLCSPLDGVVLKTKEAHGLLPRHPSCRCAFMPANVGEDEDDQKRSKSEIQKAIHQSIKAEKPKRSKRTLAEQKKRTKWAGADTKTAKKRPEHLFGGKTVSQGIPQEIIDKSTKEEMKEFRRLIKERGLLNKKVKAGTATEEERRNAEEVKKRLDAMRADIRARGGVVKPAPTPKPKPKPKPVPKPAPAEPLVPTVEPDLAGLSLKERLAKDPELNEVLDKVLKHKSEKQDKLEELRREIGRDHVSLNKKLLERANKSREYRALRDAGRLGEGAPSYFDQTDEGRTMEWEITKLKKERDAKGKKWSKLSSSNKKELMKLLEVAEGERISVQTTSLGRSLPSNYKKKLGNASKWISGVTRKRPTNNSVVVSAHVIPENGRAFHKRGSIHLSDGHDTSTFVHEIMHEIEQVVPDGVRRSKEFRSMRIKESGRATRPLVEEFSGSGFQEWETGNPDDWEKLYGREDRQKAWYIGKEYRHESTEVLTMGAELLYNDPAGFAEKDPEYFKYVVGFLRGKL